MHHPTQFESMAKVREADFMREAQAHRAVKQAKQAQALRPNCLVRRLASFVRNLTRPNPFGRVKPRPSDSPILQPRPGARQLE